MSMNAGNLFIDTGFAQCCHFEEKACGDSVAFKRIPAEERLIAVLADGLGHGIKANILATMTTTMALRFSAEDREIEHYAEIIMDALPVCQVRKISYATFTIVDTRLGGKTSVVEMGNPEFLLMRAGKPVQLERKEFFSPKYRDRVMSSCSFQVQPQDRIIFFSDGVTQAGIGSGEFPLGWRAGGVEKYVAEQLAYDPEINSQELAERILREAIAHEPHHEPADDISAACLYFRKPKKLLLFTGPPYNAERDAECAVLFREFEGTKVISGGTSAEIIARELKLPLTIDLNTFSGDLPPSSTMPGADLVTEGIFTLSRTAKYLEEGTAGNDPVGKLAEMLRSHDIINFLVGTRINEAHQDPNLPVDLELRRNIVKRLGKILKKKYMKDVEINFV